MRFYSLISSLILSVFLLFISGSESMKTLKHLTVRRGESLTVPCLYEEKYKSHPKYLCRGYFWSSCTIVAKTNTRNTGISVTDHPSQNMFTVDLKNLQDSDSGWYWCAVEIGGYGTPDVRYSVYLTVSSDPAVWVENSRVIGQEGGRVSVQGNYSSGYENKEKKWCRVKTWSCYPFQDSTVNISDDWIGSSRVEMIGLQESDAGWYWFSAGGVGVTVHLTVTERPTTTTAAVTTLPTTQKTTPHQSTSSSDRKSQTDAENVWVLVAVGLVLLLILFSLLTYMLRRSLKSNQSEAKERGSDPAVHMTSTTENTLIYSDVIHDNKKPSSSAAASENEVTYSSVRRARKKKTTSTTENTLIYSDVIHDNKKPSSSAAASENEVTYSSVRRSRKKKTSSAAVDRESDVTYSSVRKAPKSKTFSPAVGDDGVIYSSVIHEQEVYANAILQTN
ncbi:uncharacterized protein LOC111194609 isoform X4 [Astyanax mexicanus]|uniref:uncharacterized protein LOC111194609 isoform X4 n=1 Tax=Astyanax mexicanus TaxID=7994 RepID=UPI0020CAD216|nr:uncharacterized protein LOC111194609 isoform X4 [Astyanax mexicanus]